MTAPWRLKPLLGGRPRLAEWPPRYTSGSTRLPLLRNRRAGRRLGARDPIEVCDQTRQQGDEQTGLLVREVAQDLMITPEQDGNRVRQARFCDLRQSDAAHASVSRIGRALNQPVPLHAGEHLRHWRLV